MPHYRVVVDLDVDDAGEAERVVRFALKLAGASIQGMSVPVRTDVGKSVSKEAQEAAEVALTEVTMATVRAMATGMTYASQLARHVGASHQGVANRIKALMDAGWAERIPESERRLQERGAQRRHYRLTPLGVKRLDELVPGWNSDA
jgi:DNA-binding HxlR family transcriptional regulator